MDEDLILNDVETQIGRWVIASAIVAITVRPVAHFVWNSHTIARKLVPGDRTRAH